MSTATCARPRAAPGMPIAIRLPTTVGKAWAMQFNCALQIIAALLVFGSAGLATSAESAADSAKRQSNVRQVVEDFVTAWNRHDIDVLVDLFTVDGKVKTPAGEGARTRPGIRKLLTREHREIFREATLAATTANVTLPGTGSAIATGTYTLSGIPVVLGIEVAREGPFTFRLVRRRGRWLITDARIAKD